MGGSLDFGCLKCGFCVDYCPYEVFGEEFSLRGRVALLKEFYKGRFSIEEIYPYIINCILCKSPPSCPRDINMIVLLKKILSDEAIRERVKSLLKEAIQLPKSHKEVSGDKTTLLLNKIYTDIKHENVKLLIKFLNELSLDLKVVTFSYPFHLKQIITMIYGQNSHIKVIDMLKRIGRNIVCLDEYTCFYLCEEELNVRSSLDLIVELLNEGRITILKSLEINALLALPAIKEVASRVKNKCENILRFIPKLIVKPSECLMDLPLIGLSTDYWLEDIKSYYSNFLDRLIEHGYHAVLTDSPTLYDWLGTAAAKKFIAISYIPTLILALSR